MDPSFIASKIIINILMFCCFLGGVSSIFNDKKGIGKEFIEGINTVGPLFLAIGGVMSSVPFLAKMIRVVIGPVFSAIGTDPSIAATTLISTDMGGYQLAYSLANSFGVVGYMSGATFAFTIPVGLLILDKSDHKYFTMGILSGLLAMPFGVFISSAIMSISSPSIRSIVSATAPLDTTLDLSFKTIAKNIWPLILFTLIIVICLWFFTKATTKVFIVFGWLLNSAIKFVFLINAIELTTGGSLSFIFRGWGFDPIIADADEQFRALEVAALIALVLAGGYPLIFLLKTYLSKPISRIGEKIGLDSNGTLGLLASTTNVIVMFLLLKDMKPRDKVLNVAFAVSAAFLIGDNLAYNLSIQPGITIAVLIGKLCGGIAGIAIAHFICKRRLYLIEEIEESNSETLQEEEKTLWELMSSLYLMVMKKVNPENYSEFAEEELKSTQTQEQVLVAEQSNTRETKTESWPTIPLELENKT